MAQLLSTDNRSIGEVVIYKDRKYYHVCKIMTIEADSIGMIRSISEYSIGILAYRHVGNSPSYSAHQLFVCPDDIAQLAVFHDKPDYYLRMERK